MSEQYETARSFIESFLDAELDARRSCAAELDDSKHEPVLDKAMSFYADTVRWHPGVPQHLTRPSWASMPPMMLSMMGLDTQEKRDEQAAARRRAHVFRVTVFEHPEHGHLYRYEIEAGQGHNEPTKAAVGRRLYAWNGPDGLRVRSVYARCLDCGRTAGDASCARCGGEGWELEAGAEVDDPGALSVERLIEEPGHEAHRALFGL